MKPLKRYIQTLPFITETPNEVIILLKKEGSFGWALCLLMSMFTLRLNIIALIVMHTWH